MISRPIVGLITHSRWLQRGSLSLLASMAMQIIIIGVTGAVRNADKPSRSAAAAAVSTFSVQAQEGLVASADDEMQPGYNQEIRMRDFHQALDEYPANVGQVSNAELSVIPYPGQPRRDIPISRHRVRV